MPNPLLGMLVFLCSFLFGLKIKYLQLLQVSPELPTHYLAPYWIHSAVAIGLLGLCFWFGFTILVHLFFHSIPSKKFLNAQALPFFILLLAFTNLSPPKCLQLLFLFEFGLSLFLIISQRQQMKCRLNRKDLLAFVFIFFAHFYFSEWVSPKSWDNAFATSARDERGYNAFGQPLHRTLFVAAKAYDFSGFSHSFWGGLSHSTNSLYSFVVPFLTVLLDLPAIDVESFQVLNLSINFFWIIFGAFGYYLYSRYALHFSFCVSLYAGLMAFFLNPFFAHVVSAQSSLFMGFYLTLPFLLLGLEKSFEKDSLLLSFLTGGLLSLMFYILSPHPDVLIHGALFLLAYLGFLFFRYPNFPSLQKILCFGLGSALVAPFRIAPILEEILQKELTVWGHREEVFSYPFEDSLSTLIRPVFHEHGIFLIASLALAPLISKRPRQSPHYFFFLAILISGFSFLIPGEKGLTADFLRHYFPSINFIEYHRVAMYLSLSALFVSLYGLEFLLNPSPPSGRMKFGLLFLFFFLLTAILLKLLYRIDSLHYAFYWLHVKQFALPFLSLVVLFLFPIKLPRRATTLTFFLVLLWVVPRSHAALEMKRAYFAPNPQTQKIYIALSTLVVNYKGLGFSDPASLRFLQSRLCEFEKLSKDPHPGNSYCDLPLDRVLETSQSNATRIDDYYLRDPKHYFPISYSNYSHAGQHMILDFNNAQLFSSIPSRLGRILPITDPWDQMQIGIGDGYFVHNATWEQEARWLSGYRPIHSLYMKPLENYSLAGKESGPKVWRYGIDMLANPDKRKISQIGGLQYYYSTEWDFNALKDKPNLEVLPYEMHPRLKPPFVFLKDNAAYHLAYLASKTTYIPPLEIGVYTPLFKIPSPQYTDYQQQRENAVDRLKALDSRHAIYLESPSPLPPTSHSDKNSMKSENILGNKAAFQLDCRELPCRFVLNYAAISGWKAFSDSVSLPISRANFAFMSVDVPIGKHLVWFEHRRVTTVLGIYITLLSLLLMMGLTISSLSQGPRQEF